MSAKRNRINVWSDNPTKENVNYYFAKTITLYNQGEYEEALEGFEKLYGYFDTDLKSIIIPHIEKCHHVLEKILTNSDKRHLKNQAILKYFGWIDWIKYCTGIASSLIIVTLLVGVPGGGIALSNNILKQPWYFFVWAIVLAVLTFLLHKFMKIFTISAGLIRCKYCGKYTDYINPNVPTYGTTSGNNCSKCGRSYPIPDFYWDGWEGSDYMENRKSVYDEKFYNEYNDMKVKFAQEYSLFKSEKEKAEKLG